MLRRSGLVAFAALSSLLLSGASSPSGCSNSSLQVGPSKGEVVGAAVGVGAAIAVGTIVIVEVHKSHHTLEGCVLAGPDGVELLNNGDHKTYALSGLTADVKVGDMVKVQGNKGRNQKTGAGYRDFAVTKIRRDFGLCEAATAAPGNTGH